VECHDSIAALSSADATRPMDWVTPIRSQAARKSPAVYSEPWSALSRIRVSSDHGSVYTSKQYTTLCGLLGVTGVHGCCRDER
jgi:hypothetical protein